MTALLQGRQAVLRVLNLPVMGIGKKTAGAVIFEKSMISLRHKLLFDNPVF